jgi:5-formyltetrahydrofolate cyclo-ligase
MADISEDKNALRAQATETRRLARAADAEGNAAEAVRKHFIANIIARQNAVFGGYWPIGTELDVRPLMTSLHQRGHVCALPVARRGRPLIFHKWRPTDRLVPGVFGIHMPDQRTPVISPDYLLIPMLAFDAGGHRVGYGGGYYDRTIPEIRSRKPLVTIGIAYAAQEVPKVPTDEFDQTLDWIVTEDGARRIERRRFPWLRRFLAS